MKRSSFRIAVLASLALHVSAIALVSQYSLPVPPEQQLVMPEMVEVSLLQEEVPEVKPQPVTLAKKVPEKKQHKEEVKEAAKLEPASNMPEKKAEEPAEVASVQHSDIQPSRPAVKTEAIFDAAYLNNPPPQYPAAAKRRNIEGTVMLGVQVSESGQAAHISIHKSSGSELLDFAALEAVSKWRFVPAKINGEAVASSVRVPVIFKLR